MTFEDLDLIEPIRKALVQEGYTTPTPIQSEAIPIVSQGYDLLGCAQTGTGKTAAFGIPLLMKMDPENRKTQAMILCPTRELAGLFKVLFKKSPRHKQEHHLENYEIWEREISRH